MDEGKEALKNNEHDLFRDGNQEKPKREGVLRECTG